LPSQFRYEFDAIPVRQATGVELKAFSVDTAKDPAAQVTIIWEIFDGEKSLGVRRSTFSIDQAETFFGMYSSVPGRTFEEKVLTLAPNQVPRIPGGGSVVEK